MKKQILKLSLPIFILLIGVSTSHSQGRFDNIDSDTVSYIIVKYQLNPGIIESKKTTDRNDIKTIIRFLKETKFENYKTGDPRPTREEYIFWINLGGWHEKIYFFENKAFIGKSQYNIDPKVVEKLKQIYNKL